MIPIQIQCLFCFGDDEIIALPCLMIPSMQMDHEPMEKAPTMCVKSYDSWLIHSIGDDHSPTYGMQMESEMEVLGMFHGSVLQRKLKT